MLFAMEKTGRRVRLNDGESKGQIWIKTPSRNEKDVFPINYNSPFVQQCLDSFEDKETQKRRADIISKADTKTLISESYTRGCFHGRNRYMVDQADVVVCAYNGQKGGTAYTVEYALNHDKIVIQIDPATSIVSVISRRNFV